MVAATSNHTAHEKAPSTANGQIKVLTDLVKSLLKAMEGQTLAVEDLKKEHTNQIEALTRTFTKQIETLKAEVAELIQAQLASIQSYHHRMRKLPVHHRVATQVIYEISPQWARHHQRPTYYTAQLIHRELGRKTRARSNLGWLERRSRRRFVLWKDKRISVVLR
jgi:hypothetical protein